MAISSVNMKVIDINEYVVDFLKLLKSKNNRLVWGSMIALATIARLRPEEVWESISDVETAVDTGSVITRIWGIKTLAEVSAINNEYSEKIFPFILEQLKKCEPKLLPKHIENTLVTVNSTNKADLQQKRINNILKGLN